MQLTSQTLVCKRKAFSLNYVYSAMRGLNICLKTPLKFQCRLFFDIKKVFLILPVFPTKHKNNQCRGEKRNSNLKYQCIFYVCFRCDVQFKLCLKCEFQISEFSVWPKSAYNTHGDWWITIADILFLLCISILGSCVYIVNKLLKLSVKRSIIWDITLPSILHFFLLWKQVQGGSWSSKLQCSMQVPNVTLIS